jgi:citrate lyase subunit beta/citryl-CoA lyase
MTPPTLTGLYVPGNRPDRFDKAVATGTQLVILDLEDAVPNAEKDNARNAVVRWITRHSPGDGPQLQVRVNSGNMADLEALRPIADRFTLRLPKVEGPADLTEVSGFPSLVALIETALGVECIHEIAGHPGVGAIALGDSDLASDIGSASRHVLDYARIRLVFAARAANLPAPMLSAWPGIRDIVGLREDTVRGAALGLIGRVAIHPSQLHVIVESFRPTPTNMKWAREVAAATASGGVTTLASGEMVDGAMLLRAQRILDLERATSESQPSAQ